MKKKDLPQRYVFSLEFFYTFCITIVIDAVAKLPSILCAFFFDTLLNTQYPIPFFRFIANYNTRNYFTYAHIVLYIIGNTLNTFSISFSFIFLLISRLAQSIFESETGKHRLNFDEKFKKKK